MFQIDSGTKPYDSVFYDNVKYGTVTNTAGSVTGKAYYTNKSKVSITSANNQLGIKMEQDAAYTMISIPEGNYTMEELANVLNQALGSNSTRWKFETKNAYEASYQRIVLTSGYYDRLVVRSVDGGVGTTIALDSSSTAYDTLFTTTYSQSKSTPKKEAGTDPYILGQKTLEPAYIHGKTQISSSNPITIDSSNNVLNITYKDENGSKSATLTVEEKVYTSPFDLATELNKQIQNSTLNRLFFAEAINGVIKLVSEKKGSKVSFPSVSGGFYDNVLCKVNVASKVNAPSVVKGKTVLEEAYVVGRADINNNMVEIKKGVNDVLSIDFTYPAADGKTQMITLETVIPAGIYTGTEICRLLTDGTMATDGMDSFNEKLKEKGLAYFKIKAEIGAHNTGVVGADDANAMSFTLERLDKTKVLDAGTYILDGVSGSAAYSVFYKTSGLPVPAYLTGTKDISEGVVITSENNTIGFSVDGQEFTYSIPEGEYTATEWAETMNQVLDAGDDNGNVSMVETVVEEGKWRLQYKNYGAKQNRLEAAVQLAKNTGENLQAAESRIRDTNLSDEAIHQVKLQVLTQAEQAILAQANQLGQHEVSKLLGVFL